MQDQEALKRIQLGDDEALASIYEGYRGYVITWITSKHSCALEEAKDIYQDAILIFYRNVVNGKITSIDHNIGSYLCEIVKRQFFGKIRKDKRMKRGIINLLKTNQHHDHDEASEFEHKMEMVHNGMEQIGEPCYTLIKLWYYHKLSMDNISEQLGYKNTDTAKNIKYKCMQRLRKIVNRMVKHPMQIIG